MDAKHKLISAIETSDPRVVIGVVLLNVNAGFAGVFVLAAIISTAVHARLWLTGKNDCGCS